MEDEEPYHGLKVTSNAVSFENIHWLTNLN